MEAEIISKRSLTKFYLAFVSIASLFFVLGLVAVLFYTEALSKTGTIIMTLVGALYVFMAFYIVFGYYKNAPKIKISKDIIVFDDSETYYWKDLEKIEMTGKHRFTFLLWYSKECVSLKFKGRNERFLFDDMYANSPEMKVFIQQIAVSKNPLDSVQKFNDEKDIATEPVIYYKGYQLLCFDGIFYWAFLLPGLFFLTQSWITFNIGGMSGYSIFIALWVLIWQRRLHYFGVSDDYLIVKMNNIFWQKKIYRLSDIKEVVFELPYKKPVCLRVITNTFESKLYSAATLSSKTWMQLKDDLDKKGVNVRNEGVSYEPFKFKLFN